MSDLARIAGVSKNTVSLALRNDQQIPQSTRERIQRLASQLGYRKNPVVGQLMAQLRSGAATNYKATIALLNLNEDPEAFTRHPTIPVYVEGCRRRAWQLGYTLDEFWLADPKLDGENLQRIFVSRGICGALGVGMMRRNSLPPGFEKIWQNYACVITGVRTRDPALSFACADHHDLARRAMLNALRLGYRRPALVLDTDIENLIDGRFSAGVYIAQRQLPVSGRLQPFLYSKNSLPQPETLFRIWYDKQRPDVILTLYHTVAAWIKNMGLSVPEDVGLVQLEWRQDHPDWAGMNQHNDQVGEAVVDMLVSMIHNGDRGIPPFPRATMIGSSWVDGTTVRAVDERTLSVAGGPINLTGGAPEGRAGPGKALLSSKR